MRVISGSEPRPTHSATLEPNPLLYALSVIRNIAVALTSNAPGEIPDHGGDYWQTGVDVIQQFAVVKTVETLIEGFHQGIDPLSRSLPFSKEFSVLNASLGAVTGSAILKSAAQHTRIYPRLAPLVETLDAVCRAELLRSFITQPLRLMAVDEPLKQALCQLGDAAAHILQTAIFYQHSVLLALLAELPQAFVALQHYHHLPMPALLYSLAEWVDGVSKSHYWPDFPNHWASILAVACVIGHIMRNPGQRFPPAWPRGVYCCWTKLLEICRQISASPFAIKTSASSPLQLSFQHRTGNPQDFPDAYQQASAATPAASHPLLSTLVVGGNAALVSPAASSLRRPVGIAFALTSSLCVIAYGGYHSVSGVHRYLTQDAPLLKRHTRREAPVAVPSHRALHISNFTPRDQIDELLLEAVINTLDFDFNSTYFRGVEIIARLAEKVINRRGQFNFDAINELFTQIKDLGGNKTLGISASKQSTKGNTGLITWSAQQNINLADDIANNKITRPELRDALTLIMHLVLRATETGFSIIHGLSEIKYVAVSLYYQWYLNHRPAAETNRSSGDDKDQTMQDFYNYLRNRLAASLAPFNPQGADIDRLLYFLIYLEMPNVCVGILFDGNTSLAISKQNSYAIHGDLYLKANGDELRFDNFQQTLERVKNEDIKIINLITHSEIYAAAFNQQGFIAEIHRMVFHVEYQIAEIEHSISALAYLDRMSMIAVAVSELGFNQKIPWTAKKIIPYPGVLSKERAFTVIHNAYKRRESMSGRSGAIIPRSHMIAIERHRTWLEQYIALDGDLTVMLEIDPQVFDGFAKTHPQENVAVYLRKIISHRLIKRIFHHKYDENLHQEAALLSQSILLSLKLLSQDDQLYINNASSFQLVNLAKYIHTLQSFFAQPELEIRERAETWNVASIVIVFGNGGHRVYAFNRRLYLRSLHGSLIERLSTCSNNGDIALTHALIQTYMTANPSLFIEPNSEKKCIIPQWAIVGHSYSLDVLPFDSKEKLLARLLQENLQPRRDRKINAYAETSEERELAQDPRWLLFRPWLPFIECYDFSSNLAHSKESAWITGIDGLTCALNFIPAGRIVTFPMRMLIKGVRKIVFPSEKALKKAFSHSIDIFFSTPMPGIAPETLNEFKRLYKNIYSHEMYSLAQQGVGDVLIDGIYNFIARGSPIPLPNFFKWDMPAFFDAIGSMNKGIILKSLVQGLKNNAAPAVGFIGEKIAPKVFRSVRGKLHDAFGGFSPQQHQNIISEISNPDSYLPYDVNFIEKMCTFNPLRHRCDLTTMDQLTPVLSLTHDSAEQWVIRRVMYQRLLIALFKSSDPQQWQRALGNVSVIMEIENQNQTHFVSFISISPPVLEQLQYLQAFYVPIWEQDIDALLQMLLHDGQVISASALNELILQQVERAKNVLSVNAEHRHFLATASAHTSMFLRQIVQNMQWASSAADMEDDRISARYLAIAYSPLSLLNFRDWDREFVVEMMIRNTLQSRIFLASVTARELGPFVRTLLLALKNVFSIENKECVFQPFKRTPGEPQFLSYTASQYSQLQGAFDLYRETLASRLPALFILSNYTDFMAAREGRPDPVPPAVWSLITADAVYLAARRDVNRLFYREYDRFITSYDYRLALTAPPVNETALPTQPLHEPPRAQNQSDQ